LQTWGAHPPGIRGGHGEFDLNLKLEQKKLKKSKNGKPAYQEEKENRMHATSGK
jgi:hypothetical protein